MCVIGCVCLCKDVVVVVVVVVVVNRGFLINWFEASNVSTYRLDHSQTPHCCCCCRLAFAFLALVLYHKNQTTIFQRKQQSPRQHFLHLLRSTVPLIVLFVVVEVVGVQALF